jgi:hypothetical protein
LQGRTPNQVVAERLAARRKLRGTKPVGQAGPHDIATARIIVENAKDVSQPDSRALLLVCSNQALAYHYDLAT